MALSAATWGISLEELLGLKVANLLVDYFFGFLSEWCNKVTALRVGAMLFEASFQTGVFQEGIV